MDPIPISKASGDEALTRSSGRPSATLLDFWRWAYSDCLNNTTRGVLAEFIVAQALEIDLDRPREAWAPFDLTYKGTGLEVKSSSYHQVWGHKKLSQIQYIIPKTRTWDATTNILSTDLARQAKLYILCLLAEKDRDRLNPLDLDQWRFWAVPTRFFNERARSQYSITYNSLIREIGAPVGYDELKPSVDQLLES